jgi:hypothetical protein
MEGHRGAAGRRGEARLQGQHRVSCPEEHPDEIGRNRAASAGAMGIFGLAEERLAVLWPRARPTLAPMGPLPQAVARRERRAVRAAHRELQAAAVAQSFSEPLVQGQRRAWRS